MTDEGSKRFIADYEALAATLYPGKFTKRPDYYAVNAYDAVFMIKSRHRGPCDSSRRVRPRGCQEQDQGPYGGRSRTSNGVASSGFNDVGDGVKNVHVFEIKGGLWAPME